MTPRSTGLLYALSAVSIFALQDGISKHLGAAYPPMFIAMIRFWGFAAFALVLASQRPGGVKKTAKAARPWLQISRGVLLASQIVIATYSLAYVGLAATHTIFAAAPLMVACLSVPILGEQVGWRRWTAIGIGFVGILLIVNPLQATFDWKIILPVLTMGAYAVYAIMTRLGSRTDSSDTAFFYIAVAGAIFTTAIGPFFWANITPADWGWMAVLCITGISGHYLLIQAFRMVDAVVVQPMSYLQSVMVCLMGVFLFGEVMTTNMIVGCAIVIGAGLFTLWREARLGRNASQTIDPSGKV